MGFFSSIWNAVKSAGAWVWQEVVRPAIETVGGWLGFEPTKTTGFLDRVEGVTRGVVAALETDVADLLRKTWTEVDRWFEGWLVRNFGPLAAPFLSLKRSLDAWLWDPVSDPMPIPVPVPIQNPEVLRIDDGEEG